MKHGSSNRRPRHRGNNGFRKPNKMQVFDSNGPDVRIRGTAHQVCEKYLTLAKDAAAMGDRIMAENYLQHAEHYQRIINDWNESNNHVVSSDQRSNAYTAEDESVDETDDIEDLSLPASILGADVRQKVQEGVQQEQASVLEDA